MEEEIQIRMARESDAGALLAIYAPYVEQTAVTFEYEVPSEEEFRMRIHNTLQRFPYLVAEKEGKAVGYAYASPFHERAAYGWSAELSIYVGWNARGQGIGGQLYAELEKMLMQQGILNINACIAWPNPQSVRFHEEMGFRLNAHFHQCGYKLGQWYDMVWMEKLLGEHPNPPADVRPIKEVDIREPLD